MEKPVSALLGPFDPPAFEIFNAQGGNAQGGGPWLIVCDHASHAVPLALSELGLEMAELRRHIGWDIGAAAVARRLAARLDAPAVLSGYSRLVVDCNRAPDDPTSIATISDGVKVPGNAEISAEARAARLDACFHSYHGAIASIVQGLREKGIEPVLFSIHSFTPVMNGSARPWHVGVLWDNDPRLPVPLMAALRALNKDLVVGDNQPYSARAPAGYTLRRHAEAAGFRHALVELRQDLVDTPEGAEEWAEILDAALKSALNRPLDTY